MFDRLACRRGSRQRVLQQACDLVDVVVHGDVRRPPDHGDGRLRQSLRGPRGIEPDGLWRKVRFRDSTRRLFSVSMMCTMTRLRVARAQRCMECRVFDDGRLAGLELSALAR